MGRESYCSRSWSIQGVAGAARSSSWMKRIAQTLVWWPGLDTDIEKRVQCCLECQSNHCSPPLSPLQPWKCPLDPGQDYTLILLVYSGRMFLIQNLCSESNHCIRLRKEECNGFMCADCLPFTNRQWSLFLL